MLQLASFVYCLNAEKDSDAPLGTGLNTAKGVLSMIRPDFIPGLFSFSIAFSIIGIDISRSDNTIRLIFLKDNSDPLVDTGKIAMPSQELPDDIKSVPEDYRGLDFTFDLRNIKFCEEGVYRTIVECNGEQVGNKPIYVKKAGIQND